VPANVLVAVGPRPIVLPLSAWPGMLAGSGDALSVRVRRIRRCVPSHGSFGGAAGGPRHDHGNGLARQFAAPCCLGLAHRRSDGARPAAFGSARRRFSSLSDFCAPEWGFWTFDGVDYVEQCDFSGRARQPKSPFRSRRGDEDAGACQGLQGLVQISRRQPESRRQPGGGYGLVLSDPTQRYAAMQPPFHAFAHSHVGTLQGSGYSISKFYLTLDVRHPIILI